MVAWLAIEVVTSLQGAEQVHGLLDALGCAGTAQTFEPDGTVRVLGYLPATEDVTENWFGFKSKLTSLSLAIGFLNPLQ